jgi:replicative DNA helicase
MAGSQDVRGNREQEVAGISRTLKAIAKELNIPIIALSQLNRASELRGGSKKPQLSDLRESGAIEQDADIVAFIHRPEYFGMKVDEENVPLPPGLAEFIIAKHRNGATETVRLKFRKEQARFLDFDDDVSFTDSEGMPGGEITGYDGPGGYTESYTPPRRSTGDEDAPF